MGALAELLGVQEASRETFRPIIIIIIIIIIIQPLRAFRRAHLGENVFGGSLAWLWALWELDIGSM